MPLGRAPSGDAGILFYVPQKRINATNVAVSEFMSAAKALEAKVKRVVEMETDFSKMAHKYGYDGVDPKLWSDKGGVFSKSPKHKAMVMGTKAGPMRKEVMDAMTEVINRLYEIYADVDYITATIEVPWTTDQDTSGKVARKMIEDSMVAHVQQMKAIHADAIKKSEKVLDDIKSSWH